MNPDPVRGRTLRWTYDDGAMAGMTFEHSFRADGTVRWSQIPPPPVADGAGASDDNNAPYKAHVVNDDVYVISYLSKAGYTLTTVVDTKTGAIVSFASNETHLSKQGGRLDGAAAA